MNTENNDAENVHPNELEKMEKALKDGMKKSRSHEGELKKELERMADRLQNVVKSEMEEAMNALWGKMEERMSGQERVMAALVQSVDEFMAGIPVEQKEEKEQHLKSPTPSRRVDRRSKTHPRMESRKRLCTQKRVPTSQGQVMVRLRCEAGVKEALGEEALRWDQAKRKASQLFGAPTRKGIPNVERAGMVAGGEEAAAVRVAVTLEDAEDALVDAGHMDMDAGHMGIGAERAGHTIMEDKRITEREAEMALGTVHGRGEGCWICIFAFLAAPRFALINAMFFVGLFSSSFFVTVSSKYCACSTLNSMTPGTIRPNASHLSL
ncbi:hypothetical protein niasHT_031907 [Heterodera trifolii]|uniref:Uncharacterized protein n=1 Tax=Heterodera trifolii TaxID=157864 RepID=A0ABD2I5U4_9BILA